LALKSRKLVELMMVSGIPTASGYEERIRFSEIDPIDRGAQDQGLLVNMPDGHEINGWTVNVAGVRTTSEKRIVRHHTHAVGNFASISVLGKLHVEYATNSLHSNSY
jgi:hypothetical protein